jgi:putative ABC transport system substrate-binding protein
LPLGTRSTANEHVLKAIETTAKALKVELQIFQPRGPHEFEAVFAAMAKKRVDALVIFGETMFTSNARTIVDLAAKHRLPSIGTGRFAEHGGLMSYGRLASETVRRTAYFVDRILKGAKPADLPVELPTQFVFVVNLKTAKALGVTLPVDPRADQ